MALLNPSPFSFAYRSMKRMKRSHSPALRITCRASICEQHEQHRQRGGPQKLERCLESKGKGLNMLLSQVRESV